MTIEHNTDLTKEWQQHHNSYEKYELFALIIKLVAVALTIFLGVFAQSNTHILLLLAVLWLQEGIWKTYQARTNDRLVLIEQALLDIRQGDKSLVDKNTTAAFQFYHQWRENRAGSTALIKEYIQNSLKPTVIYPYVPLMVIALIT